MAALCMTNEAFSSSAPRFPNADVSQAGAKGRGTGWQGCRKSWSDVNFAPSIHSIPYHTIQTFPIQLHSAFPGIICLEGAQT